jgi:hypothetical protein
VVAETLLRREVELRAARGEADRAARERRKEALAALRPRARAAVAAMDDALSRVAEARAELLAVADEMRAVDPSAAVTLDGAAWPELDENDPNSLVRARKTINDGVGVTGG